MKSQIWDNLFLMIMLTIPVISLIIKLRGLWRSREIAVKPKTMPVEIVLTETQEETHSPVRPRSVIRLLFAFVLWVLGGILLGLLAGMIGSVIYFTFLSPLALGFVAGGLLIGGLRLARTRQVRVALIALLVAVAVYGGYHYGRYVSLQIRALATYYTELSQQTGGATLEKAKLVVDYGLIKETGHSGLPGYMLYTARKGVSMGRFYRSDSLHLNAFFTWIYWLLEFGAIAWVVWQMGKNEMRKPVCASCGSRYGRELHLGGTSPSGEAQLLDLLRQKDFRGLDRLIEKTSDLPSTELYLQRCPSCEHGNSYLRVRRAFSSASGALRFSDVSTVTLPPAEGLQFAQALATKIE